MREYSPKAMIRASTKYLALLTIFSLLAIFIHASIPATAQTEGSSINITINLDKPAYKPEETVTISGQALYSNGTGVNNTDVYVYVDSSLSGTATTDSNGNYNYTISSLTVGTHTIKVNITDTSGNYGENTTTVIVHICDSGNYSTTCYVNSTYTIPNNTVISGSGTLVIQSAGVLTTNPLEIAILNFKEIIIESGGKILGNVNITAQNLTVYAGGVIDASGKGYPNEQGPGAGASYGSDTSRGGGGAGYGGYGGDGYGWDSVGSPYGSYSWPTDFGSGGGNAQGAKGGYGGGMIFLNVTNIFIINGTLSANGGNGGTEGDSPKQGAGGGSGGSILIVVNKMEGNGTIHADGGDGGNIDYDGGGGSGGRIAIYASQFLFDGSIEAKGGTGYEHGDNGSVFVATTISGFLNDIDLVVNPGDSLTISGETRYCGYLTNQTLSSYYVCSDVLAAPNQNVTILLDGVVIGKTVSDEALVYSYTFTAPTSLGVHNITAVWDARNAKKSIIFDVRNLTFDRFNLLDEHGEFDNILNPGEGYNLTVEIREFNGTNYFDVTSGSFQLEVDGKNYTLVHISDGTWQTNETVGTAPSITGHYSFLANVSGVSANGIKGSVLNTNYTYRVRNISITTYENVTFTLPNQSVLVYGRAIYEDNSPVSNNPAFIWIDDQIINPNTETWPEQMGFSLTNALSESANYRIVINGTNWTVYNVMGDVEISATNNNFWNRVKSTGEDIRVFDQNGNQLYFWIEEWDYSNQTAVIWINVSSGSTGINIAYGDPLATWSGYHDPERVFEFFDGFDCSVLNTTKWDSYSGLNLTVENGYLSLGGKLGIADSDRILSKKTFTTGIIVEYRWKILDSTPEYTKFALVENADMMSPVVANPAVYSGLAVLTSFYTDTSDYRHVIYEVDDSGNAVDMGYSPWTVVPGEWRTERLYFAPTVTYYDEVNSFSVNFPNYHSNPKKLFFSQGQWTDNRADRLYIDYVRVYKLADPANFKSAEVKKALVFTNTSGHYKYAFHAPLEAGDYVVRVNLTDPNGIDGKNSTILKVRWPANFTKDYVIVPDFVSDDDCSIYTITAGNYINATNGQPLHGNFTVKIGSVSKNCFGLGNCTLTFSFGDPSYGCEQRGGNLTVVVHVENETALYFPHDDAFEYFFDEKTTTATLKAYDIVVYNVSTTQDKIVSFNMTINNTGRATMRNIRVERYSGSFNVTNTTLIPDVPPETAINITFYMTIPAGTSPATYKQVYKLIWNNNENSESFVYSNQQNVHVVGNPEITPNITAINDTMEHGTSRTYVILINNTGNAELYDVWINYTAKTLPSQTVSISPSYFSVIYPEESKTTCITITLPAGFPPGNYTGEINISANLGKFDERIKILPVNIQVPVNTTYSIKVFYPNSTQAPFLNLTFPLNTNGSAGYIIIRNTGNVPLNFTITYEDIAGYANPTRQDPKIMIIDKYYNGTVYNPSHVYLEEQEEKRIDFFQEGSYLATTYATNITFRNSTALPQERSAPLYMTYLDMPPYISDLAYKEMIEIGTQQVVTARFDDDQDMLSLIKMKVTHPNGTVTEIVCEQSPSIPDGYHSCVYTPDVGGVYTGELVACDSGSKCSSESFSFEALERTRLSITPATTNVRVDNVSLLEGRSISVLLNVTNEGNVNAYNINVTASPPPGTSWSVGKCARAQIAPNESMDCLLSLYITNGTPPSTYAIQPYVEWLNPNPSFYDKVSSDPVLINVTPTRIVNITSMSQSVTARHNATMLGWILVESQGNDNAENVTFACAYQPGLCPYVHFVPSTITSLSPGASGNVTVRIELPAGFAPGTYIPALRACTPEMCDEKTMEVSIPEDSSWEINATQLNIPAVANMSGNRALLIKNLGNVQLKFYFSLEGNITDVLSINETSTSLAKQNNYSLLLSWNKIPSANHYEGNITIQEVNYNQIMKVKVVMDVYEAELNVISPSQTDPYTNMLANEIIKVNVSFTLANNPISSDSEFHVYVDNEECTSTVSYSVGYWNMECVLPEVEDGKFHNLTVVATYNVYGFTVRATAVNSIHYKDITPPSITSTNETVKDGILSAEVKVKDNVGVSGVDATITYPSGAEEKLTLSYNSTKDVWKLGNYYLNESGDYQIAYTAFDSTGNNASVSVWVRDTPLITLAIISPNQTQVVMKKSNANFVFYNFTITNTKVVNVKQGLYDIEAISPYEEIMVNDANLTNDSILEITELNPKLVPLTGVKARYRAIMYNTDIPLKNITIVFNVLPYLDQVSDLSHLAVYKCTNYSVESGICESNFTMITPTINYARAEVRIDLNESDPLLVLAEPESEISAICGNGVCEYGESPYNCPADCPAPQPKVVSSGGGTTVVNELDEEELIEKLLEKLGKKDFVVQTQSIDLTLYQGEKTMKNIYVFNLLDKQAEFVATIYGDVIPLAKLYSPLIRVDAKREGYFIVEFDIPEDAETRTYTGVLKISAENQSTTVPITIKVLQKPEELMDMKINLLQDAVDPGDTLKVQVELFNLGKTKRVDANVTIELVDPDTLETVAAKTETMAVETSLTKILTLKIPENLEKKKYMVKATASYISASRPLQATAMQYVEVGVPFLEKKTPLGLKVKELAILMQMSGVIAGATYFYWQRRRKLAKKKMDTPIDVHHLPKPTTSSLFIGNIAGKAIRAFIHPNHLSTHVMIAGATGSGKTISAMVMAEELLLKGKSVIVFDPTAQWTGFLRKCKEDFMLKKYKEFGMKKEDARGFAGKIKVVEDAYEKVDVKELLSQKGRITIFVLNKLSHKEIEDFVVNFISSIFNSNMEESHELKAALIFDEVHRLLPKFGGTGKGFLAIEKATREFRKWGIGLMLISQVLSDFVGEIRANIGMEIQFRTRYENDLERVRMKYGDIYMASVVKAGVGTGMLVFSEYNRGRPYFVEFRPILHQVTRLSDEELAKYVAYDKKLERIRMIVKLLKAKGIDVFELETELKLADSKLAQGRFEMVELYLSSLEKNAFEKARIHGIDLKALKKEKISKEELESFVGKARVETAEDLAIYLSKLYEELKDKVVDLKAKGVDVFDAEMELETLEPKIRMASAEKNVKELRRIKERMERLKAGLFKVEEHV